MRGDARSEAEAEQMHQAKDVVGHAAAIGVVSGWSEIGLMIEQAVDNVRCFAVGRDHLGVKRRVTIGDVAVDR